MLDNLLKWSIYETGHWGFEPEEFGIAGAIAKNLEIYHPLAEEKNISLKGDYKDYKVKADRNSVELVLRNLISNAIKFTPRGGSVKVSAARENGKVLIHVSDTGQGISRDTMDAIFTMDRKKIKRGTENEKGSGLGLVLSKEFAEKQGGNLSVESEEGKGTTFTFSLPEAEKD